MKGFIFFFNLCIVLFLGITFSNTTQAQDFKIIAIVGEQAISSVDMENRYKLALFASGLKSSPEIREKLLPQIQQVLINEALYREEAKHLGYEISAAELAKAMRQVEKRNNLPEKQLTKFLIEKNVPIKAVEDQLTAELLWDKIIARHVRPKITITELDIDEGVERSLQSKVSQEVNLSEIVLPVDLPEEESKISQLANKLSAEINAGADFSSIARQFSRSVTASGGGVIGWIEQSQLAADVLNQIQRLEIGKITAPLRTAEGYQILRINDRRTKGGENAIPASRTSYGIRQAFVRFTADMTTEDKTVLIATVNEKREALNECNDFNDFAKEINSSIPTTLSSVQPETLSPEISDALQKTPVGKVSPIINNENGLHVFMVCSKSAVKMDAERRAQIKNYLYQQKLSLGIKQYLQTLRQNIFIDMRV